MIDDERPLGPLKRYKRFLGLKNTVYMTEATLVEMEKEWPDIRKRAKWDEGSQCWVVTT